MFRYIRLVLATLIAVAFLASGWSGIALASVDCAGCHEQKRSMGHMDGKEKPAEDCMQKMTCSIFNAQLPVRTPGGAIIAGMFAGYPSSMAVSYRSHHILPDPSPPRFIA